MDLAYHRLDRSSPKYRWWKPLVTAVLAFAFYLVFTVILVVILVVAALLDPQGIGVPFERFINEGVLDNSEPVVLAFSLAAIALMLPSIILARLIMGPRPLGLLSSVAGRLRWGWMLRILPSALVAYGASFALYLFVIPLITGEPILGPIVGDNTWILLVIIVLLVPLQATAEEYVFRGFLMQTFGGWLRHPLFAIALSVPFFVIGHTYDLWGLADVAVFGIAAAWLTWRTGGLEAAIVAHVINNTAIFALGSFDLVDINTVEGSAVGVFVSAVTLALYSWLVIRAANKANLQTALVETQPLEAAPIVETHS